MAELHLVLVEPEIPPNTGNAARSCVLTGTGLHLVEPLGFSLSERELRRAGLDYWAHLDLMVHEHFSAFRAWAAGRRLLCFSTRGDHYYHDLEYRPGDCLIFGSETKGLGDAVLEKADCILRIPMVEQVPRSLNLGNAAAVVLFEALRQQGFPGMV